MLLVLRRRTDEKEKTRQEKEISDERMWIRREEDTLGEI